MTQQEILTLVHDLMLGQTLSEKATRQLFDQIVSGSVDDVLLSAAVSAIKVRTQSPSELAGAALALLDSATSFPRPDYAFADIVGTGGDGYNTINLSTIAAITSAACGLKIVKHGNRSVSSVSGSFDLLQRLGIDFDITAERSRECVDQFGICFLFAPNYHAGLRHVAHVRKTLKTRTIFNLLGPLVNPARPPLMLLGVADPALLHPMATVLARLQCASAFVVHGSGVDEVAVHDATSVVQVNNGQISNFELTPADFGATCFPLQELVCHNVDDSHQRSMAALSGQGTPAENTAVCVNVALAWKLFGHHDLKANFSRAMECLVSGQPMNVITEMVKVQE